MLPGRPYASTIKCWADAAHARNRNPLDQYGPHGNGGRGASDYGCRPSVLDPLNADASG